MPTATPLTGTLGTLQSQLGLVQLGGPPLVSTWGRPLASKALPLLGHAYANDGVTSRGTFPILNRPVVKATTANGGYDAITLEVPSPLPGPTVRTNLIGNPSFESGIANGWLQYSSAGTTTKTQDATQSWDRANSLHVSATSAADGGCSYTLTNLPAGTYSFSVYVKTGASVVNACAVVRRDDSSAQVAGTNITVANQNWTRVTGTFMVVGGVNYDVVLGLGSYGAQSAGDAWFDAVLIEQASSVGAYFDGATPAVGAATHQWTGTADNSQSTETNPGVLSQGNVVRLSEVGGPFKGFVYSGIAEAFPDTVSPTGVKHEITLAPFGIELSRVYSQALYTMPTDLGQVVRDAVSLTQHCFCDEVSVPTRTGISLANGTGGQVDFRNQSVQQVLDTCRSIAGSTWYWFADESGRVWFQPMGSGPVYTILQTQYTERISNGGSIESRKNQVPAVGGVPTGGTANITAVYNGASQSSIGVRSLNPPLSIPNITDQAALNLIAAGVGAVLDRVWNRIQVKATPAYTQRIHGSQPGGAMVRTWEPAKTPMAESEAGTGYAGPYIAQEVTYDGLFQQVVAGDIPVTSQTDVDNMVKSLVSRAAANSLQVTAAALNLQQTVTGSFQSGTGTISTPSGSVPSALWALNQKEFAAYDPSGFRRAEMGNLDPNGVSPAQWGFRANDASGNPIFDSLGLIGAASLIASETLARSGMAGSGTGWSTVQTISGSGANFTLSRQGKILCYSYLSVFMNTGQPQNYMALYHAIWSGGSLVSRKQISAAQPTQGVNSFPVLISTFINLSAGSYQFRQEFALDGATTSCAFGDGATAVFPTAAVIQLGG